MSMPKLVSRAGVEAGLWETNYAPTRERAEDAVYPNGTAPPSESTAIPVRRDADSPHCSNPCWSANRLVLAGCSPGREIHSVDGYRRTENAYSQLTDIDFYPRSCGGG